MHMHAFVRRAAGGLGLGVLAAGLVAIPGAATANPAGTALVISEVYGGGGNSGAPWTHDFVELYNPTDAAISVESYVVEYFSGGSGNSGGVTPLTGSVPARGHYLVRLAGGTTGNPLPAPEAIGTSNMSATTGSVELRNGAAQVDLVGYGTGAAVKFEGAGAVAPLNNTTAASRNAQRDDTDNNSADFGLGAPTPQNSGTAEPPPPPPDPVARTIAEVQGTGPASPIVNQDVIVQGVVTAAYPTGGFNGFYIQTPGPDTTPGASDGLFVYEPDFDASITVGDSVEVEGTVKEFSGLTEVDATEVTELSTSLGEVVPNTELPGTTCSLPGTNCPTGAALEALYEELEGEAILPTAPMTVTDSYDFGVSSSSFFGEIGLAANSTLPLVTPTEVVDAQDTAGIAARTAYNEAHRVVLDDGSSTAYWDTRNTARGQDDPLPWLTADHTVRVGAAVTFHEPVVLDYRFGWKLQPQRQVVGEPTGLMTFEQDRPAAPAAVGGDLELATFNVLNYFTTFGADVPGCTAYVDRDDNPIATASCTGPNGPRGAWNQVNFDRQQAKIVNAINTMDADIVSLEELENSARVDGGNRDEAIAALVAALNADAGFVRWSYVPSPSVLPASEDVIRNGFIYNPATVKAVGESQIHDVPAFDNAREPVAQVFNAKGGTDAQKFAVIANHFKSKGSGVDDGTGQGNANPDRIAQAKALTAFASTFAAERGTDKVFLTGDFNAYSMEDPVQEIEAAGYVSLKSTDDPDEETYSFSGTSGSLDHVFANAAAKAMVTGVDIWEINANEPVYYQYSRYNYVGTDLYRPDVYAASDHNPEIVGIKLPVKDTPAPVAHAVDASVTPKPVVVNRTRAVVHAKVSRGDGAVVKDGTVEVREGNEVLASGPVNGGVANVTLPRFTTTGEHALTVRYLAGTTVLAEKAVTVTVLRAASEIRLVRAKAVVGKRAVLVLRVTDSEAGKATGKVKVKAQGKWRTVKLVNGRAKVSLGRYKKAGKKRVVVKFAATASSTGDREVYRIRVKRR